MLGLSQAALACTLQRVSFFASKGVGSGVRTVGRIFRATRLPDMRAALESFAPCSSPAGVDEIAERRHSHWLDRKAGKARCSAATKFTGQDGLAKARRVSRTPSSGTRHSLSSLRQQDSLLPSARVHCPASKALSALSQPFGDLLPPRVSFGAKASSCFPLGTRTCTQRGCWSLPTKVGPSLSRPATGREYKEPNTAHRGLLRSTSIPYPNFFVPSPVRLCSPWLLSPTSSMLPPNSSSPSSRRTSPSCKRPSSETCSHLTLPCLRACTDAVLDWIGDAGQRPRRSSS